MVLSVDNQWHILTTLPVSTRPGWICRTFCTPRNLTCIVVQHRLEHEQPQISNVTTARVLPVPQPSTLRIQREVQSQRNDIPRRSRSRVVQASNGSLWAWEALSGRETFIHSEILHKTQDPVSESSCELASPPMQPDSGCMQRCRLCQRYRVPPGSTHSGAPSTRFWCSLDHRCLLNHLPDVLSESFLVNGRPVSGDKKAREAFDFAKAARRWLKSLDGEPFACFRLCRLLLYLRDSRPAYVPHQQKP